MKSIKTEDSFLKLSKNAIKAINKSYDYAKESKSQYLDLKHLFLAIINQKDNLVAKAFESSDHKFSISFENLGGNFEKKVRSDRSDIIITNAYKAAIIEAFYIAKQFNHVYVGVEHLFLSILKMESHYFVEELKKYGIDQDFGYKLIANYANYPPGVFLYQNEDENALRQITQSKTILENLAINLNNFEEDNKSKVLVGREKELNRIIHILSRRNKNNPMILGDAGIGKTALVEFLAYKIYKKEVPENLLNAEIWSLDISKLMMATEMRGELEGKLTLLMDEIKQRENVILFIDEIHMIFNSSGPSSNNDIANMLKPHLTSDKFRVIGATTLFEYQRFFESDAALNRRFLTVKVKELTPEDSVKAVESVKSEIEVFHNVKIHSDAVVAAVQLSDRYIIDRYLPDKAIDVLEEASTFKGLGDNKFARKVSNLKEKIQKAIDKKEVYVDKGEYERAVRWQQKENEVSNLLDAYLYKNSEFKVVMLDDIANVISNWTGIPIYSIRDNNISTINKVYRQLKREIIGQDNALNRVIDFLKSDRAGLRDPSKPIAKFLFLGPTGVGKTELAKQIAIKYMGSIKSLIQIDMSEYMEAHSVSKFIGSPPGYIGYQEGGRLTESVKNKPYSVVLFDEIEKAHPDVLNILLQIMEEGHLTDSRGRFVNFKNTIIVMTSNIGADIIENNFVLGFDVDIDKAGYKEVKNEYDKVEEETMFRLKEYLLPEFINRIDDIIIFRSLNKSDALRIVKKLSFEYCQKINKHNINVTFSKDFQSFIVERGFSEEFGVRQLKRLFDKYAETTIANFFINNPKININSGKRLDLHIDIDSSSNTTVSIKQ